MNKPKHLRRRFVALVFILTWAVIPAVSQTPLASQHETAAAYQPPGDLWAKTELYFGTSKPDGTVVTDQDFKGFLDEVVTPRFPDGLTLLAGFGQFRNSTGIIVQERSMLLILFYPASKDANQKIEEIRRLYLHRFNQESVLRADSLSLVSF
jgi:hypothetical protein